MLKRSGCTASVSLASMAYIDFSSLSEHALRTEMRRQQLCRAALMPDNVVARFDDTRGHEKSTSSSVAPGELLAFHQVRRLGKKLTEERPDRAMVAARNSPRGYQRSASLS
jgi:hypothetical protein